VEAAAPPVVNVGVDATAAAVDVEPTVDAAAEDACVPKAAVDVEADGEFAEVQLEMVVFPPSVIALQVHTSLTAANRPGGWLLSQVLFR